MMTAYTTVPCDNMADAIAIVKQYVGWFEGDNKSRPKQEVFYGALDLLISKAQQADDAN